MPNSFSLLFHLKKPKRYKYGPVPIYMRITVNGSRAEVSTHRECDPEKWNGPAGRMNGSKEQAKQLNAHLDSLVSKLYGIQTGLINNGTEISAEVLKNEFTGIDKKQRMLIEIVQFHNDCIKKLIGKDYAQPTLTKYNSTLTHLKDFIRWKFKVADISITMLKFEFLTDFEFYLKTEKNIGHNTTAKYIKNTKKIINESVAKGWLKTNPFLNYKIKTHEVIPIFLSKEELYTIETKSFAINRLGQVRDMFVFSCYTGLSFIDVFNLTPNHISIGIDGKKWILTSRQKNNIPSHIPLLPPAMSLIQKYANHPLAISKGKLLPILSNQKMNAYLKEIADICGIHKELTYHCARHTFATTVTLTNGVPIESVSKMLGHKKIQTTQHYAKILDQKVSSDMSILFNKYKQEEEKDQNNSIAK